MKKCFPTISYGMAAVFLCLLILGTSLASGGVAAESSMSEACTSIEEIHESFPEAYWEGLDALIEAHPEWRFVAFYEGVTFEECLDEEAEMKLSRNLAAGLSENGPGGYYYPTSWYSTELTGSYNWAGNAYYGFDNGNMFQASEEAVRYCMDPRNWFTEEQIFQFLDSTVPFAPEVSEQIVQYIFETIGVAMWVSPAEETGLFTQNENGETVYFTYPELVDQLAAGLEWEDRFGNDRIGVNQATMATRIRQEHGSGKSKLIAGDYPFTLPDGTLIPGGYYNYFAMDASGNSIEQIYNNGLIEAYNYGWDTRYKSIAGGMKRYTERYFADCQYCPYMLKFNVRSDSPRQYWGQYMQDIFAPQKEARNLYRAISSVEGAMDSAMTFIIPVYDSLPETISPEPDPERIGNPNYKLGSIFVDGTLLDGFHMDKLEYELTVPNDKASVRLNASAYAGTTSIRIGSADSLGTISQTLPLNYGSNVFDFFCTAENGLTRNYRVTIIREPRAELKSLSVDGRLLSGFDPDVLNYVRTLTNAHEEAALSMTAVSEGAEITCGEYTGTGSLEFTSALEEGDNSFEITVMNGPDTYVYTLILHRDSAVVYGDVNSDGEFDSLDLAFMTSHLLGINELEGIELEAADINGDESIDSLDLAFLTAYLLGNISEMPR